MKLLPAGVEGKNAVICSDSEAMIKALRSPVTTSALIKKLKENMNRIGLRLVWVPGDSGVQGNEIARQGSASSTYGPEPIVPTPNSLCIKALRDWTSSEFTRHWNSYEGGVHTKHFFPETAARHGPESNKEGSRHCGLNKHLVRSSQDGTPRRCQMHLWLRRGNWRSCYL